MIGRSIIKLTRKHTLQNVKEGEGNVKTSPRKTSLSDVKTPSPVELTDSIDVNFEHYRGTITELWALAIHKYPDIVSENGIFSGLLLESMLGIERVPTKSAKETRDQHSTKIHGGDEVLNKDHFKFDSLMTRRKSLSSRRVHKTGATSSSIGDNVTDENDGNLIRPRAPLVRSMRRCQYKWLPLLDSWQEVDVVLTKYELVWLATEPLNGLWDKDIESRRDSVTDILRSHKGGKGISLSDAITGREIIGRLALEDIDEIKVQRFPARKLKVQKRKIREKDAVTCCDGQDFSSEFWGAERLASTGHCTDSTDERFKRVMEDNLILYSRQGTLCLRFLVDLVNEERGERNSIFEMKEGALLWCQTISHLCGPRQLKQKLPHFGENADKELLDFIEMQDRRKNHQLLKTMWKGVE
jgi:hypothetical protein